jgi:hypothetical protein
VASTRALRLYALIALTVGLALAALLLSRQHSGPIAGNLTQVGGVALAFGAPSDDGVSPVCGCMHAHLNEWRGLTYAARTLTLTRSGGEPLTEWYLSIPEPSGIAVAGLLRRLSVTAVTFIPNASFDPMWIRDGVLDRHARVVQIVHGTVHGMKIIDSGRINVALLGPTPIAAWIPMPRSLVTLGSGTSAFPGEAPSPEIHEHYSANIGAAALGAAATAQKFPLGDFLGPDLVFWTADPGAIVPGLGLTKHPRDAYTAVYVGSQAFAVQMAAIPFDLSAPVLRKWLSYPPAAIELPDIARSYQQGDVHVAIASALSPSEYGAVRARILKRPITTVREWTDAIEYASPRNQHERLTQSERDVIEQELGQAGYPPSAIETGHFVTLAPAIGETPQEIASANAVPAGSGGSNLRSGYGAGKEAPPGETKVGEEHGFSDNEYHWPPLPAISGVNVFGPLTSLRLDGAVGSMLAGDTDVNIPAPAQVDLSRLVDLRDNAGQQLITAPLLTSGSSARIQFSGVGRFTLNGVDESTKTADASPFVTHLLLLFAVLGGVSTLLGLVVMIRRKAGR